MYIDKTKWKRHGDEWECAAVPRRDSQSKRERERVVYVDQVQDRNGIAVLLFALNYILLICVCRCVPVSVGGCSMILLLFLVRTQFPPIFHCYRSRQFLGSIARRISVSGNVSKSFGKARQPRTETIDA